MAQRANQNEQNYPITQDMFSDYVPDDNKEDGNMYTLVKQLLERDNDNTPDWRDRKIEDWIPIFVYGTLKAGGRLHRVLENAFWLGDGITAGHDFNMYDTGGFPVVRPVHASHEMGGKIFGELYMVDPVTLLELDRIEGNGEMYERRQIWIWAQDQAVDRVNQETGATMKARPGVYAWAYIGCNDFWRGQKLDQVIPKMSNGQKYYDWNVS